jgi:dUTP pyrophosphatase
VILIKVKIQKIRDVKLPSYAHPGDSGMDLYAAEACELKPLERKLIPTGIKMAVPRGYEAQVRPKSGLALNHGITIANTPGTVDSGYRGEVGVIMLNVSDKTFKVEKNTKIAQLVICKVEEAQIEEVSQLEETSRNEGGFGSTGLH